jgi:hypothetical protein
MYSDKIAVPPGGGGLSYIIIENNELTAMLLMYGQCYQYHYHIIRVQLRRPESTQSDFRKDTILGHVSY